jgi:ABC-type Fe3+ transport system permease subunit
MHGKKSGRCREAGLSEVIGFILIIGLIVVIASLYLTYGVPAQGRENEILHMNLVKDQFVTYKISLDSLFNNDKVGTAVSNSFTLGTSGGYTQG